MKVRVVLFAGLREKAGTAQAEVDALAEGASVRSLIDHLEQRWPFLRGYPYLVARNLEMVDVSEGLHDGDEVALLPPVSGG